MTFEEYYSEAVWFDVYADTAIEDTAEVKFAAAMTRTELEREAVKILGGDHYAHVRDPGVFGHIAANMTVEALTKLVAGSKPPEKDEPDAVDGGNPWGIKWGAMPRLGTAYATRYGAPTGGRPQTMIASADALAELRRKMAGTAPDHVFYDKPASADVNPQMIEQARRLRQRPAHTLTKHEQKLIESVQEACALGRAALPPKPDQPEADTPYNGDDEQHPQGVAERLAGQDQAEKRDGESDHERDAYSYAKDAKGFAHSDKSRGPWSWWQGGRS